MTTSWHYSPATETARLLHTAHQIANRFYPINGFFVVPTPPKPLTDQIVIFPNYPYPPSFWTAAKHLKINESWAASSDIIDALTPHLPTTPPDTSPLQQTWSNAEGEILSFLSSLITLPSPLTSITFFPTHFGTAGSFNRIKPGKTNLEAYLRSDVTLSKLVEIIIDALTRHHLLTELDATWAESEIISDWLLTQTQLKDIIAKHDPRLFQPLIKTLRHKQNHIDLEHQSRAYLQKLGYTRTGHLLEIKDDHVYFQDQRLRNLTPRETVILTQLIENHHLTTDQLADLIFTKEDDFSLYAIAKTMQRLRDKLEANGLSGSTIQTQRGKGYSLRL